MSKGAAGSLTARQARFVLEYLVDLNATQAAIRAGYAPRSATVQGARLLANAKVAGLIRSRQVAVAEKLSCTADDIARELHALAFANILDYLTIDPAGQPRVDLSGVDRASARAIHSVKVKEYVEGKGKFAERVRETAFRMADKRACLVDLAKLLGFWRERLDVKAESLEDLLAAVNARADGRDP